ncbi:MAG: hypothetical protein HN350_16625 [Phycisphaerales bacterium]|jgi:hypothetical protein|nr:hypothetical protein [Phycisphaerales bacterium]
MTRKRKLKLHNSPLCLSRVHCENCRTLPTTRRMLLAIYHTPDANEDDFPCPEGFTAGATPKYITPAESPLMLERLAICKPCDDECSINHQTQCRRKAILAREHFHCPNGRF